MNLIEKLGGTKARFNSRSLVADKYKDHISDDAYNALINYEVSIDD